MKLRLLAPAKINWTLEVLHRRPDGYHEVRSVVQTIDLCDTVTLRNARHVTIHLHGESGMLAGQNVEMNFAYRAAVALRERAGDAAGARIDLEKRVPVAAGLGGGSSNAAAVLRGLNVLWGSNQTDANLIEIAGEIGSDPPFFVVGGTAAVSRRGDHVEALPDAVAPLILLATPPEGERSHKTSGMFAALSPGDFADGYVTIGVREIIEAGRRLVDDDLNNVFERVTSRTQPLTELAMDALRMQGHVPHLAGAGPSFFLLLPDETLADALTARVRDLGFEPRLVRTLDRDGALRIEQL